MRITHVCPFIGEQMGGSERYVYNLSKVQAKNHSVEIVTTTKYPSRRSSTTKDGVKVHRVYAPVTIWNIDPLCYAFSTLTTLDYDVLHIHSYLYSLSAQAVIAKVAKKRKAILQIHGGLGPPPYKTSLIRRLVKQAYDNSMGKFVIESSDYVASVSRRDLQFVREHYRVDETRLKYVPNAVDDEVFSPDYNAVKNSVPTITYVGDLEPWKGLGLLKKWALKTRIGKPCKLRLVGHGSLYPDLVELRRNLQRTNNGIEIELLGQRPHHEIPHILRESDALVLPSYWEGMPTVVLEAMACGIPPVVTPVGDVERVVENQVNGLLIDHSVASIDNALNTICSEQKTARQMGRKARETIEAKFSIERAARIAATLYEQSVSRTVAR